MITEHVITVICGGGGDMKIDVAAAPNSCLGLVSHKSPAAETRPGPVRQRKLPAAEVITACRANRRRIMCRLCVLADIMAQELN